MLHSVGARGARVLSAARARCYQVRDGIVNTFGGGPRSLPSARDCADDDHDHDGDATDELLLLLREEAVLRGIPPASPSVSVIREGAQGRTAPARTGAVGALLLLRLLPRFAATTDVLRGGGEP